MWGEVSLENGEVLEQDLKTNPKVFKNAIDTGAVVMCHDNTAEGALGVLHGTVHKLMIVLSIQDETITSNAWEQQNNQFTKHINNTYMDLR